MRWVWGGRAATAAFALIGATDASAQDPPRYFESWSVGAVSIVSGAVSFPALSAGLTGSLDLINHNRMGVRVSATGTGPMAYNESVACTGTATSVSCFDASQHASQVFAVTGDLTFLPFGSASRLSAVVRAGRYGANPARSEPYGGDITEPERGTVLGVGVERGFFGEKPRMLISVHALQYRHNYGENAWAFTVGLSTIVRR